VLENNAAVRSGIIGNGQYGLADVDVYAISLAAGSELIADVIARNLATPSTLDSYLRLFDSTGRLVAANDDYNGSYDSRVVFSVQETGIYYLGVSAFGNYLYDVNRAGSGREAHTFGEYDLSVEVRDAAFSSLSGPSHGTGGSGSGSSTQTLTR